MFLHQIHIIHETEIGSPSQSFSVCYRSLRDQLSTNSCSLLQRCFRISGLWRAFTFPTAHAGLVEWASTLRHNCFICVQLRRFVLGRLPAGSLGLGGVRSLMVERWRSSRPSLVLGRPERAGPDASGHRRREGRSRERGGVDSEMSH